MSELDALPADQRAALQLLLKQGKSYDQLAELLGIDAAAVRSRAHSALDALGPEAGQRLAADRRAQVADYLLGQQSGVEREAARELLAESAAARAWARGVSGSLRPVAGDALPEIPGDRGGRAAPEAEPAAFEEPVPRRRRLARRDRGAAAPAPAASAPDESGEPSEPGPPGPRSSSRLGGALLLGGLGIIIAVVLVLVIGGGDDDKKDSPAATNPATQTNAQRPVAQINLFSTSNNRRQAGLAQVFQQGERRAIIVAGQGVEPGAYALWMFNSKSDARLLGFVPERVGRDGRFATQGALPANAERFEKLVVTREQVSGQTRRPPSTPGPVVLQGDLKLGGG